MDPEVIDYNGQGKWSVAAILSRYSQQCRALGIEERDLRPMELLEGNQKWIYPILSKVIDGLKAGDPVCRRIAIELIEEDEHFPFGKILKSQAARYLRRLALTEGEKTRLRARLIQMLIDGNVPHEYHEYARLLKRIGLGEDDPQSLLAKLKRKNVYVMKHFKFLTAPM